MVLILILKRLCNRSDDQMEYSLLEWMCYQHYCGLAGSSSIPDRATIGTYGNRISRRVAQSMPDGAASQLLRLEQGYITRGGQIIGVAPVLEPKQLFPREDKAPTKQGAMTVDWLSANRQQKALNTTLARKPCKNLHGYQHSINVDRRDKVIRKIEINTASVHDSQQIAETRARVESVFDAIPRGEAS